MKFASLVAASETINDLTIQNILKTKDSSFQGVKEKHKSSVTGLTFANSTLRKRQRLYRSSSIEEFAPSLIELKSSLKDANNLYGSHSTIPISLNSFNSSSKSVKIPNIRIIPGDSEFDKPLDEYPATNIMQYVEKKLLEKLQEEEFSVLNKRIDKTFITSLSVLVEEMNNGVVQRNNENAMIKEETLKSSVSSNLHIPSMCDELSWKKFYEVTYESNSIFKKL